MRYDGAVNRLGLATLIGIGIGCGPQVEISDSAEDGTEGAASTSTSTTRAGDDEPPNTTTPPPPPPNTTTPPPSATNTTTPPPGTTSPPPPSTTGPVDTGMFDTGDSSGTAGCIPQMLDCPSSCGALYDCGVEAGCMFSGDPVERQAFVDNCVLNPLCDAAAPAVNTCDCAGTVQTFQGLSPEFTEVCDNGFG